ncbi:TPA: hypothetical protein ACVBCY_002604, partial [Aeromonas hydrophila]
PYHSGLPIITSEAEPVSPEDTTLSDSVGEKCASAEQLALPHAGTPHFNSIKGALVNAGYSEDRADLYASNLLAIRAPELKGEKLAELLSGFTSLMKKIASNTAS